MGSQVRVDYRDPSNSKAVALLNGFPSVGSDHHGPELQCGVLPLVIHCSISQEHFELGGESSAQNFR